MLEFEFIQIAVGCKGRFSCNPSLEDWTHLLHFAQKQSLVEFLFWGIEKLHKDQLPQKELLLK